MPQLVVVILAAAGCASERPLKLSLPALVLVPIEPVSADASVDEGGAEVSAEPGGVPEGR